MIGGKKMSENQVKISKKKKTKTSQKLKTLFLLILNGKFMTTAKKLQQISMIELAVLLHLTQTY